MGLLQNKVIVNQYPVRLAGTSLQGEFKRKLENHKNIYVGEGMTNKQASTPNGYEIGFWLPPRTGGGLATYQGCYGESFASGNLAKGLPCNGTAIGDCTVTADLELIVGLNGTATGSCTLSGDLAGVSALFGTANGDCTLSGDLGAIINMTGTAYGDCTFSANLIGFAHMSGISSPFTELSPENLANAVWTAESRTLTGGGSGGLTVEEHEQLMATLTKVQFLGLK